MAFGSYNNYGSVMVFVSDDELRENSFLQQCRPLQMCPNRLGYMVPIQKYQWAIDAYQRLYNAQALSAQIRTGTSTVSLPDHYQIATMYGQKVYRDSDGYLHSLAETQRRYEAEEAQDKAEKEAERAKIEFKKKKHDNNIKKLYWARKSKEDKI